MFRHKLLCKEISLIKVMNRLLQEATLPKCGSLVYMNKPKRKEATPCGVDPLMYRKANRTRKLSALVNYK